ncbi:MAG: hypothetical protein GY772_24625, partial [bacterium]|nr:hypothetical protein [bacterium]
MRYYGADLELDGLLNASLSTITLSERCSTTHSMLIGGTAGIPSDGESYSMRLLDAELSQLASSNVHFDSQSGAVYVAGFEQSTSMNGVSGGWLQITAATLNGSAQRVVFGNESATTLSGNSGGVTISGNRGIDVWSNISSSAGPLLFVFADGDLNILQSEVHITTLGAAGNIDFSSSAAGEVVVSSLPVSISAKAASSNVTVSTPIVVNRSSSQFAEFGVYSGNVLECTSSSTGIRLQGGGGSNGALLNLHSAALLWDTSSCTIDTDANNGADIIWLHPTCSGTDCVVQLGVDSDDGNYSLSAAELAAINSSNTATVVLGDRAGVSDDVGRVVLTDTITFGADMSHNLFIASLHPDCDSEVVFRNDSAVTAHSMELTVFSYSDIRLQSAATLSLLGAGGITENKLLLQASYGCGCVDGTLFLHQDTVVVSNNGAVIDYYGRDLHIEPTATLNASLSRLTVSERCSSSYSMQVGGTSLAPGDGNTYSMNILQPELARIHATDLVLDSNDGAIYVSGFDQDTNMGGVSGGGIEIVASTLNGSQQTVTFGDAATSFSSNDVGGVSVIAYNGISVQQNVSSNDLDALSFHFIAGDLTVSASVFMTTIGSGSDLSMTTSTVSAQSVICTLPCSIRAQHSTSSVLLDAPLVLKRDSGQHSAFHLFAGNKFKCLSNSAGISLQDASSYGATVDLEAADMELDTATCSVRTNYGGDESSGDILWFRPPNWPCNATDGCTVRLGTVGDDSGHLTLSTAELALINTSGSGTLHLGDRHGVTDVVSSLVIGADLSLSASAAQSIYLGSNRRYGDISISDSVAVSLSDHDVYLLARGSISLADGSSLRLSNSDASSTRLLRLDTDMECDGDSSSRSTRSALRLGASAQIWAVGAGRSDVEYYGNDVALDSTSSMNVTLGGGHLLFSEQCSSSSSLLVGGTQMVPSNGFTYNLVLLQSELSTLFAQHLVLQSANGSVHVSEMSQSSHMGGISGGSVVIRASSSNHSSQYVEVKEGSVSFSGNDEVSLIGSQGLYIDRNLTNHDGTTTLNMMHGDLTVTSPAVYIRSLGSGGHILFEAAQPSSSSIIVDELPSGIMADHSTANISFDVSVLLRRSPTAHSRFLFYSGHQLQCLAPSSGITLYGDSAGNGATIDLQSALISWDTSSCYVDTNSMDGNGSTADVIWLHPTCEGLAVCTMNVGGDDGADGNYTVTDAELDNINSSGMATVYLGDTDSSYAMDRITVYELDVAGSIGAAVELIANSQCDGDVVLSSSSSAVFALSDVELKAARHLILESGSLLRLDGDSSHSLALHSSYGCCGGAGAGSLTVSAGSSVVSTGGAAIDYDGGDVSLSATGTLNSTQSSITISERCSTNYSMAIGGSTSPSDGNSYALTLLQSELARIHSKDLRLDSYSGSIFVSGLQQSSHLSGVLNGRIEVVAATANTSWQFVQFNDGDTEFSGNSDGVLINGYAGISVYKNISNQDGTTSFKFSSDDMLIAAPDVEIASSGSQGDIYFISSPAIYSGRLLVEHLPFSLTASHSTSDIAFSIGVEVNRSASSHRAFSVYVGNELSFVSPSTGLLLRGDSAGHGATIELQSANLVLDASSCRIDTTSAAVTTDVIWLHPTCSAAVGGSSCMMHIGDGSNSHFSNYSLSSDELNAINTSSSATLYLGDRDGADISKIYVGGTDTADLTFLSSMASDIYLRASNLSASIVVYGGSSLIFNSMDLHWETTGDILLLDNGTSIKLALGAANTLWLETDSDCAAKNGTLQICDGCSVSTTGNSPIVYHGGDLVLLGNATAGSVAALNSTQSSITLSERCSATNSLLIGGSLAVPGDSNLYEMVLLRQELALLSTADLVLHSLSGDIYVAGVDQQQHMSSVLNGKLSITASAGRVTFDDDASSFSSNTGGGVHIYGEDGISVMQNVSNSDDVLTLQFINGDLDIGDSANSKSNIHIVSTGSSGNIVFLSNDSHPATIAVDTLPTSIRAEHSSSNVTLDQDVTVKRDSSSNLDFELYVGHVLECRSPSAGIAVHGSSADGATINLQSRVLVWDSSTCRISTDALDNEASSGDVIWLHPTCSGGEGGSCDMHIGDDSIDPISTEYALSNAELNTIDTADSATVYLGDYYSGGSSVTTAVSLVYLSDLDVPPSLSRWLYVHGAEISVTESAALRIDAAFVYLISLGNISMASSASMALNSSAADGRLFLQTDEDCASSAGHLVLSASTSLSTTSGAELMYYGGDVVMADAATTTLNASSSTMIISERCSSSYSMAIGGSSSPSDGNSYALNLVQSELTALHAASLELISNLGAMYVSGFTQSVSMSGVSGGHITMQTLSGRITFGDAATILDSDSNGYVEVDGYDGITVSQDISTSSGYLKFIFHHNAGGHLVIHEDVDITTYGAAGHIVFDGHSGSQNNDIRIESLPVTIWANDSAANISLSDSVVVNRSTTASAALHLFVGDTLSCHSPSAGISLQGQSQYGSRLHLESAQFNWDTTTCKIESDLNSQLAADQLDEIWLHPTCDGLADSCTVNVGTGSIAVSPSNYSISDEELDTIDTASPSTLYLGDIDGETSDIAAVFVASLSAASSVASALFISALNGDAGSIKLTDSTSFDGMDVSLWANDRIEFASSSSLELLAGSAFKLSLQSNKYCAKPATGALDMASSTTIRTAGGAPIEIWVGDFSVSDSSAVINASASTLTLSERCSSVSSMAVGGSSTPSDGNTYAANIVSAELESLFAENMVFDSLNGTIWVSGFDQSSDLSGVSGGKVSFVSNTANGSHSKVVFNDGITTFSAANSDGVDVVAFNGIEIYKNVTSLSAAPLLFSFPNSELVIGDDSHSDIHIVTKADGANIEFVSAQSILVESLPTSIRAEHATANVSIVQAVKVRRDADNNHDFSMYVGNVLECASPSTGISVHGSSADGATINLESGDLVWDTATCTIDTNSIDGNASDADVIWLHPNCGGDDCFVFLGADGEGSGNWTLSDAEMDTISCSNKGSLFLGDRAGHSTDVAAVYVDGIDLASSVTANLYISSLNADDSGIVLRNNDNEFTDMNVAVLSNGNIVFSDSASLSLDASASTELYLHSNRDCLRHDLNLNNSLRVCSDCHVSTRGGATMRYYGADLELDGLLNASLSTITLSERCSTTHSMLIGGSQSNSSFTLNLLSDELSNLYTQSLILDSYGGAVEIAGFSQSTDMSGVSGGDIVVSAQSANTSFQHVTFSEAATSWSGNDHVSIIGHQGINIEQDVSTDDGSLTFEFQVGPILIWSDVSISSELSMDFVTASSPQHQSIFVQGLPVSISTMSTSSNLSISTPIVVNRSSASHEAFELFAGDVLRCNAPSTGITLRGDSNGYGATLSLEASDLIWDSSACSIDSTQSASSSDVIWVKPSCSGSSCSMWVGDGDAAASNSASFWLSDDELNMINSSNTATVYLGDWTSTTQRLSQLFVADLDVASSVAASIHFTQEVADGVITLSQGSSQQFRDHDVYLASTGHITLLQDAALSLVAGSSNVMHITSDSDCISNGSLLLLDGASIATQSGAEIEFYGHDLELNSSSQINATSSTLLISEHCSWNRSLLLGGSSETPLNGHSYHMNLQQAELRTLSASHLVIDSVNGSIYVSGMTQSEHMDRVKGGSVHIRAATANGSSQYVEIREDVLEFEGNPGGCTISGTQGIYIDRNVTNLNGTTTLNFVDGDLLFTSPSVYIDSSGSDGDVIFVTDGGSPSIVVSELPAGIRATHSSSDISLNVPLSLSRAPSSHSTFELVAGHELSCVSPSNGITLDGAQSSALGATIEVKSALLSWAAQCSLSVVDAELIGGRRRLSTADSSADVVWFHPPCSAGDVCVMYLGGSGVAGNHSVPNSVLNSINTSSLASLYLGDRYSSDETVSHIFIDSLQIATTSSVAANLYIQAGTIRLIGGATSTHSMNVQLVALSDLALINNASLELVGNAVDDSDLLLESNALCQYSGNSAFSLCTGCQVAVRGGSTLTVYGSDIELENNGGLSAGSTFLNASTSQMTISERCSSACSVAFGGDGAPSDSCSYLLHLRRSELSSLLCRDLVVDSQNGSIFVSGVLQGSDMSGVSGGSISVVAASQNGSYQHVRFDDAVTEFEGNTAVHVVAARGVDIAKNLTNLDGTLTFQFVDGDLTLYEDVWLESHGAAGDIEFISAGSSIIVDSLPVTISASAADADVTLNVPTVLNRATASDGAAFHLFVGHKLELNAPITLQGDSLYGGTVNIESAQLAAESTIDFMANAQISDAAAYPDQLWLHPTCSGSACFVRVGGTALADPDTTGNYSLSDEELDRINTSLSPSSTLYLGDIDGETSDIAAVTVTSLSAASSVASALFISALNGDAGSIKLTDSTSFDGMD